MGKRDRIIEIAREENHNVRNMDSSIKVHCSEAMVHRKVRKERVTPPYDSVKNVFCIV